MASQMQWNSKGSTMIDRMLPYPVVCFTVYGDAHTGVLQGIDNNFNLVIDKSTGDQSQQEQEKQAALCFIRGETVVYIGFNDKDEPMKANVG
ncbi:LSM domain [Trypanosoma melophagium]|uniref:LSM domain n=1 Tax=Trypanosoma melophagium TaxID=715481 RepID=UPI00351AB00A|nr:LSM domain [Trypanosoma melophagium]